MSENDRTPLHSWHVFCLTDDAVPTLTHQPSRATAVQNRALGSYLGFAVGDALGATVEFMTPHEIRCSHGAHRDIIGGGWLQLPAGRVTDDTEMCLALGEALVASGGWELRAVADSYVAWMRRRPVDIGNTCRRGLHRYLSKGTLQAEFSEDNAGNGAAMRNLPLAIAAPTDELFVECSLAQARITHHHPLSDAATLALGRMTRTLLRGGTRADCRILAAELGRYHPEFRFTPWPGNTSGYIVDTVQTVFESFFATDNFEDCLVRAVNHGGDADTIGALTGQLAGACYGVKAIPLRWLERLDPKVHRAIRKQTAGLLALAA